MTYAGELNSASALATLSAQARLNGLSSHGRLNESNSHSRLPALYSGAIQCLCGRLVHHNDLFNMIALPDAVDHFQSFVDFSEACVLAVEMTGIGS